MAWTADQEKAINECGKNIIVSAGAGSGKTAVLSERVVRKVNDGVDLRNILILHHYIIIIIFVTLLSLTTLI